MSIATSSFNFVARLNPKGKWVHKGKKPQLLLPWMMQTVEGMIKDHVAHNGNEVNKNIQIRLTEGVSGCILHIEISDHE
jgi:hypothetical protein